MPIRLIPVNHFDGAAIAVSPAAVATLPVTALQTYDREQLWRSPNLEPQVITGHWNGNVRVVDHVSVWPSAQASSLIGSRWRFEFFRDADWIAGIYDTGTLDYFAFSGSAFGSAGYGVEPYGVDPTDRTARIAPLLRYFTAVNAGSFRITVTNGGAVDTPYFEARRIWMGQSVVAPRNANFGAAPQWLTNSELRRTIGGSAQRLARARWRGLRVDTRVFNEADRATWSDLLAVCTPEKEIILTCFPGEGARRERDFTVMGSFETLNPMPFMNRNYHTLQLAIVES